MIMKILFFIAQLAAFLLFSPFLSGLIARIKNNLRMRKGQSIFQPYFDLVKLFSKENVVSGTASWIYRVTPLVVLSATLTAALFVPIFIFSSSASTAGDFLVLVFVFAAGRFFMALSALDTASSFGGLGASREMFISSLAEPVFCLAIFALYLEFGSTGIIASSGFHNFTAASFSAGLALFMVMLAETSRIPIDNRETHLELTMIHEAMVLEYSGKSLAFLEMAGHIRQMIWFFLIAQIILPISVPTFTCNSSVIFSAAAWFLWYAGRIILVAIAIAVLEVSVAKMRLFRAADFFGFGFILAVIAVIAAIIKV
ncbi:MAG: NADH-quinone oxidoreductase subunit H [Candidatus Omnitrophica bacterium]|nr:NADH-quinone oxidoreductase subunit H [Candidatus Omnitrophota bacterium]